MGRRSKRLAQLVTKTTAVAIPVLLIAVALGASLLGTSEPVAAEEMSDAAMNQAIERGKARQDRLLKSYTRRNDTRGLALFAEQERQRAERDGTAINVWLAGRALHAAKKKMLAHRYLSKAWAMTGRRMWPAGLRLALMYMEDKRPEDALKFINPVLRRRPTEETAIRMQVDCLMRLQRWDAAIAPLLWLFEREPQTSQIWDALSRCYAATQQPDKALPWLQRLKASAQGRRDLSVDVRLAEAYMALDRWAEARPLLEALRTTPIWEPNPQIQRQLVITLYKLQDAEAMYPQLREYVARAPDDLRMQELYIMTLRHRQDNAGAIQAARALRDRHTDPKKREDTDALVLVMLLQEKRFDEALAHARRMRKETNEPKRREALDGDILRLLLNAKDLPGALTHARAMQAQAMKTQGSDPQRATALGELIARLERGEDPMKPVAREQVDPDNPFVQLVKRCLHEDVTTRRKALQEYYELNLPLVDPIIYRRFAPEAEPDADCRLWVVRILGRFDMTSMSEPEYAREVARRLALALEDPAPEVRTVAAEELGDHGVPAALIYLMPHLWRVDLDTKPPEAKQQKVIEREYNAVRSAIVSLTGHRDLSILEDNWVPYAKAKENRQHWHDWLDTESAEPVKLRAFEDLAHLTMEGAQGQRAAWFLRFSLDHCFHPSRWQVARAAYRLLRDARRPTAEGAYGALWQRFPVWPDEKLVQANHPALEAALKAWWASVAQDTSTGSRAATAPAPDPKK